MVTAVAQPIHLLLLILRVMKLLTGSLSSPLLLIIRMNPVRSMNLSVTSSERVWNFMAGLPMPTGLWVLTLVTPYETWQTQTLLVTLTLIWELIGQPAPVTTEVFTPTAMFRTIGFISSVRAA